MFALNRRKGERFLIVGGSLRAHIKILNVKGDQVRLGIRILAEVPVRPMNDQLLRSEEMNGGDKQGNGKPRRSRRPRRVWPPVDAAHLDRY